jgi:ABC-type dipeptide/oligopeptide/nickel transport system permease subunit
MLVAGELPMVAFTLAFVEYTGLKRVYRSVTLSFKQEIWVELINTSSTNS